MSTFYEEENAKSDAELCKSGMMIEPEWTRAHALAEKVMAQFQAEHFQPLTKKIADHVTEHLWYLFRDHLIDDTAQNIAGHIRDRIDRTIRALLGGEAWAVNLYVTGQDYGDYHEIRKTLAAVIPVELQDARIKDLEAEIATLRAGLTREQGWNARR